MEPSAPAAAAAKEENRADNDDLNKSKYKNNEKSNNGDEPVLLHGDLDIHIIEARHLPNMDLMAEYFRRCFAVCRPPSISTGGSNRRWHHRRPKPITSDPYVAITIAEATVARTRVIPNCQDPVWDERFRGVCVAHAASRLIVSVKDNDMFGAQLIGAVWFPVDRLARGEPIEGWFPIIGTNGKPPKPDSAIHLAIRFHRVDEAPSRLQLHGDIQGVPDTYFPLRKGCAVTLYQDAHVREGQLPQIDLGDGRHFQSGTCWEDICHAILEAHHLIYLVGWSIYHKVRLVREPTRPLPKDVADLNLGDLLKYKSQEGVRVCLLVWDDKTSHHTFFIKTEGMMRTHDEETRRFFKHSSVICMLSPRYASSKLSLFKQQVVGNLYTHHQKCVLVDTQGPGNNRKISAFIGGLDLCDGRYDTPEHRIFKDLDTVFQNDFHNPTFATETKGPRQPWHDWHSKIEGPAAYDVLKNFEQRWLKARKWWRLGFRKASQLIDDALIKLERISWILSPTSYVAIDDPILHVSNESDSETWHAQIFRSIDSGSVKGFPKVGPEATEKNLVCGKNLVIDKSIHAAYIKAIRSAKHFIYIENQYFLGSSYAWPSYTNSGADNLIPMEIALKVASKIRDKERFAVYIVIPMWPEGAPTDNSVQEILYWQGQTIQMMYGIIGKELKSANLEGIHPQDYLNFYCLGNREELSKDMSQPTNQTSGKSAAIYGYRMSLWAEHLSQVDDAFKEPHSLECVRKVNEVADRNWERYIAEEVTSLEGHLLKYPIKVQADGRVGPLPGSETFPDVGGKVLGAPTSLPDALTM